jgi:hypothetical protein
MEIAAGEGPVEGRCGPLVMGLKGKQAPLEFLQRREIVGRENLSLNDREIDFDLVEPTGVNRCMNEDYVGPFVT